MYAFICYDFAAYRDEKGPWDWSKQRFENVISLRQQALQTARERWADYLLVSQT